MRDRDYARIQDILDEHEQKIRALEQTRASDEREKADLEEKNKKLTEKVKVQANVIEALQNPKKPHLYGPTNIAEENMKNKDPVEKVPVNTISRSTQTDVDLNKKNKDLTCNKYANSGTQNTDDKQKKPKQNPPPPPMPGVSFGEILLSGSVGGASSLVVLKAAKCIGFKFAATVSASLLTSFFFGGALVGILGYAGYRYFSG